MEEDTKSWRLELVVVLIIASAVVGLGQLVSPGQWLAVFTTSVCLTALWIWRRLESW